MKRSLTDLRDEMRAVARGERRASPLPARALLSVLSSQGNLDLLKAINQHRPQTVTELTELLGRVQPNVSRSLQQLAKLGLIRLEKTGKEVRPVPLASEIDIDLIHGTYTYRRAA